MTIINTIIKLIMCHLLGDYVLQVSFIAETKGNNWYHLFVHCALYCLPFFIAFGLGWQLAVIFATHMIIDHLKARYGKINYITDQKLNYAIMVNYLI